MPQRSALSCICDPHSLAIHTHLYLRLICIRNLSVYLQFTTESVRKVCVRPPVLNSVSFLHDPHCPSAPCRKRKPRSRRLDLDSREAAADAASPSSRGASTLRPACCVRLSLPGRSVLRGRVEGVPPALLAPPFSPVLCPAPPHRIGCTTPLPPSRSKRRRQPLL